MVKYINGISVVAGGRLYPAQLSDDEQDRDDAFHLVPIIFNEGLTKPTRIDAVLALNEALSDSKSVRDYLVGILKKWVIPQGADINGVVEFCKTLKADEVKSLFCENDAVKRAFGE